MNYDQSKLGTELILAIDTPENERIKSMDLNVGYDSIFKDWELIIKYSGDIEEIASKAGFTYTKLLNNYAIIRINELLIEYLSTFPQITFIEKPKSLYINQTTIDAARSASCMIITENELLDTAPSLTGKGVLIAVIDSGVNIFHPYFRLEDNTSKILSYWDQSIPGNPPDGYNIGTVYTREDLNSLSIDDAVIPRDITGHGTAVAGIITKSAPDSDLLVVKLEDSDNLGFPRTTFLMQAIDYVVKYAAAAGLPLVINISLGNNYGDHAGNSVLEDYINNAINIGKVNIVTGMGNDGNSKRHSSINVESDRAYSVDFQVQPYESAINLQAWHSYQDDITFSLITPRNEVIGPFNNFQEIMNYKLSGMSIAVLNGTPSPINPNSELYISIIPDDAYIEEGIWSIQFNTGNIINGIVDIWLPVADSTSSQVIFLNPDADVSLTIPASSDGIISVAAYDLETLSYAAFSGRGYTRDNRIKPEISAPGVNILTANAQGGEVLVSGTSFSSAFVSGGAALLMQWGITEKNDPFLYAKKLKSYIIRGARKLPGYSEWPNKRLGYGALCVRNSIPI